MELRAAVLRACPMKSGGCTSRSASGCESVATLSLRVPEEVPSLGGFQRSKIRPLRNQAVDSRIAQPEPGRAVNSVEAFPLGGPGVPGT